MKYAYKFAIAAFAIAMSASTGFATTPSVDPVPLVKEVQSYEFMPFGVTQNTNLEMIGCKAFGEDIFDCSNLPEKNDFFKAYTVETRNNYQSGICNVRAYSTMFRGDHTGYQVRKAYDQLTQLMVRKYGAPTGEQFEHGENGSGYKSADQFSAALAAGVKNYAKEWKNIPGKLPSGVSIKMTMMATNEDKTFVELSYFLGGPGCANDEERVLRGL
ncbi:hypothetical protein D3C72_1545930 [compost metagenome]